MRTKGSVELLLDGHAGVLHIGVLFAVNGLGGYPSWPRFKHRLAWCSSNQERHFASLQISSTLRNQCCRAGAVFVVVLRSPLDRGLVIRLRGLVHRLNGNSLHVLG